MADHPTVVLFNGPTRLGTLEVPAPTTVGHVPKVAGTSPLSIEWGAAPGGSSDHATLSHLSWTASGHTGTASRIAAFDGGGAAAYLAVGTDVQAWSARLDGLAGTAYGSADLVPYTTAANTFSTMTVTSTARTLLDDTSTSAMRTTLGVAIGSNVQAWSARLDTLAGLTRTRGDLIVGGSSDWTDLALGASGYYLKSDGTDAVWAALPTASTSAAGLVEIATPNEYADGKVLQTSDWRARYSQNRRMYGARVMSLTTTPARDGVLSGSDFTGTQAWAQETTQGVGPYFDMVLTTASSRGWGSGTTLRFASLLSRCRFRQLVAWTSQSTTRTGAGFGPTVTAISDVATATAVGVRFVNDGGTLKGAAANGTSAEQTAAFAALTDGTFYWLEYDCDGTTANFYVYDVAGTLIEGPKTLNTYVPGSSSTNCAFGMYSRATSGTPSHYDGGTFVAWGT